MEMFLKDLTIVDIDNLINSKTKNLSILIPEEVSGLNFDKNEEYLEKGYISCSSTLIAGDYSSSDTINRYYQKVLLEESLQNKFDYINIKIGIHKGKVIYKLANNMVNMQISWCNFLFKKCLFFYFNLTIISIFYDIIINYYIKVRYRFYKEN